MKEKIIIYISGYNLLLLKLVLYKLQTTIQVIVIQSLFSACIYLVVWSAFIYLQLVYDLTVSQTTDELAAGST